jgi:dihydrodipicolinate synthase/N-acetylneuraminate lyase
MNTATLPSHRPAALATPPRGAGVIPPLVTPCTAQGSPDLAALHRLVERQIAGGVHGVFVLGTTGEGPALSMSARCAVVSAAVSAAMDRVPVLVGVTDSSFDALIELSNAAADAGVWATVVAPPPYSPTDVAELNHYLDAVASKSALPFYLYNIPSRTGPVPMATVRHAMTIPNCVGFKDSSGQMVYLHEAIMHRDAWRRDFRVLVGPEELLAESVMFGADGGVAGGANLFPSLFVRLFDASRVGDLLAMRRLHNTVMQLSTGLYRAGRYSSSFIKSVKSGLYAEGLCEPHMVLPYEGFRPEDQPRLRELYEEARSLVAHALSEAGE